MKSPIIPDLLFGSEHTVFRSETLAEYLIPEERPAFAAWKRGDSFEWPHEVQEFVEATRADVERGVRHVRVRAVPSSLTDYIRFEFAFYPELIKAGMEIRVIEGGLAEKAAAFGDFYLFDGRRAAKLLYDSFGGWQGEEELDEQQREMGLVLAQQLLNDSIPFDMFARHQSTRHA
jgi:hypothetical protein